MLLPLGLLVVAKVPVERLLAPRAVNRVRDGSERGDGFVFAGVAQELFVTFLLAFLPRSRDSIHSLVKA